jgi:hypothetical protein
MAVRAPGRIPGKERLPRQMSVGPVAAQGRRDREHAHVFEARGTREAAELVRLEPQPHVGLLAHRFVLVANVVDDDHGPPRSAERRQLGDDTCGPRRVMKNARSEHGVCTFANGVPKVVRVELRVHETDVAEPTHRNALARLDELRRGSIDGDDALVDGREQIEKTPGAGSCIDGERAFRKEKPEGDEVRAHLRGRPIDFRFPRPREELVPGCFARPYYLRDPGKASITFAKGTAAGKCVGHHRIASRFGSQPDERPRSFSPEAQ